MSVGGGTFLRHLPERHCRQPLPQWKQWFIHQLMTLTGQSLCDHIPSPHPSPRFDEAVGVKADQCRPNIHSSNPTTMPVWLPPAARPTPPPNLYLSIKGVEDDKTKDKKHSSALNDVN